MVLEDGLSRAVGWARALPRLSLVTALALAGCITARPAQRASQAMPVALAVVLDYEDSANEAPPPKAVTEQLVAILESRNLVPRALPFESYSADFATKRITASRLADLAAKAGDARTIALLETKVVFYSALSGMFRWTVYSKATIANVNKLSEAVTTETTFAMFMDYEHEREDAVLTAAARALAEQMGHVADDFLSVVSTPVKAAALERRPIGAADSIYFVMVDRFENGDPSNDGDVDKHDPQAFHGGDLQGVINRLDYIQKLGFTTVWLSPVFKMRTAKLDGHGAFHGYWVEDFTKIEPRFGTEEVLVKLSNELHRRGMKLMLDVVLNHVGYDAPLARQHPEWFHHNGDIKDWNDRKQLETYDVHGLPDLAQEREDVYQYLLATSLMWIDKVHPDGFRLDAVKHVPLTFWARYNEDIRRHAGQEFMLLGEDLDGDPERLARTLKEGKFTSVFDFPLRFAMIDVFCKDQPRAKLAAMLFEEQEYLQPNQLVTLLDNHDLSRLASACGGHRERIKSALAFLLTSRGTPVVMYGTEHLLDGENEPANRADMPAGDHAYLSDLISELLHFRAGSSEVLNTPATVIDAKAQSFLHMRATRDTAIALAVNDGDSAAPMSFRPVIARLPISIRALSATDEAVSMDDHTAELTLSPHVSGLFLLTSQQRDAFVPTRPAQPRTRRVRVSVDGAPTASGDDVLMAGGGSHLGNWDVARAIGPLHSEADGKRLATAIELPTDGVFEFKFVVKHKDGSLNWETRGNRYLLAGAGCTNFVWNSGDRCAQLESAMPADSALRTAQ
jgi:glycosidase